MKILCATGNAHKVDEIRSLLKKEDVVIPVESALLLGQMPEVEETADSFAGNAELKARALTSIAPKGSWILSDDSGLCVESLDGAPGLYSARFAGPDASTESNNSLLLERLENVPEKQRSAFFVCVLCLIDDRGTSHFFRGECHGSIATSPVGKLGFGYDPLFIPDGYTKTLGELGPEIKDRLSHRARAIQDLAVFLKNNYGKPN